MIFPTDAEQWVGKLVVLTWQQRLGALTRTLEMNSGGRVLRVDDTYLYLQPFGLPAPSKEGDAVTHLRLQIEEEKIALVDIDVVFSAPLDGIRVDE